jgi:hypothetical protein
LKHLKRAGLLPQKVVQELFDDASLADAWATYQGDGSHLTLL